MKTYTVIGFYNESRDLFCLEQEAADHHKAAAKVVKDICDRYQYTPDEVSVVVTMQARFQQLGTVSERVYTGTEILEAANAKK